MALSIVPLFLVSLTGGAMAAPPPPAVHPSALDRPVDGYDMRQPYQLWRYWVENQKGPVTEALLRRPDEIEGLQPKGLLIRFTQYNDFGHYLTGDLAGYCRPTSPAADVRIPGNCRYVLRRAYVPLAAEDYGAGNPVSDWTRANFDAPGLARHFREIGMGPGTDWWSEDRSRMFAAAPSPHEVLARNAVVTRLDSIECPEMGQAIEALEGRQIDAPIDLSGVGEDHEVVPPRPHAVSTVYTIDSRADGGSFQIQGSDGPVARMVYPILQAADICERAREPQARTGER